MTDSLAAVRNRIIVADVRDGLAQLPDHSIDCVVTSPPYWGLRDYDLEPQVWDGDADCEHCWEPAATDAAHDKHNSKQPASPQKRVGFNQRVAEHRATDFGRSCTKCNTWEGCLGLEPTIEVYLRHLLAIFDDIRRVLKPTGTCWVNLGDCYRGGWNLSASGKFRDTSLTNVQSKSLCLVPHRFAVAMIERGWIMRNHVVWHKPNCLPQPVRDRFTNTWDHMLLFVKQPRYWFNLDAVRVPHRTKFKRPIKVDPVRSRLPASGPTRGKNPGDCWQAPIDTQSSEATAPPPDVGDLWVIPTRPSKNAHFATFPERFVELPIRAGCPPLVCKRCGVPKRDIRHIPANPNAFDISLRDAKAGVRKLPGKQISADRAAQYDEATYAAQAREVAISEGCSCRRGFHKGIVLDPFMGSGTVAVVARRFARDFVGFECKPAYAEIARQRLRRGRA